MRAAGTKLHLLGFVSVMVLPTMALAQQPQPDARARAEAQKLYEDGAKDLEADDYARACPKFEAAWKILPDHIRTGVTLADCLDKWGKPASALSVLEKVAPLAQARGDKAKISEIEATMADLGKRVPRLTITVSETLSKTPGLAILRAGTPVPPASWGTPVPLDPGEYEIEASAVDKPAWKTKVRLDMGKTQTVEINPGWPEPEIGQPPLLPPPTPQGNGLRTVGFVGVGLGALGFVTWGVLGGLAISRNSASKAHCNAKNLCDDEGFGLRNSAVALGHGASVGLIAGSIFAATGVTLIVITGRKKETKREGALPGANLWIGPSSVGIRGTF